MHSRTRNGVVVSITSITSINPRAAVVVEPAAAAVAAAPSAQEIEVLSRCAYSY
jgi:hypothetical protein